MEIEEIKEANFGRGKGSVNYKLLIALVLMKEWGFKLNAYKIIKLNRRYRFDFFKASKPTIYKYSKQIELYFNDVKRQLRGSKFLEEY